MDKEKISKVLLPSTEIIKQLSPLDAQNLTFFHPKTLLPIAEYKLHLSDNKYLTLQKDALQLIHHKQIYLCRHTHYHRCHGLD